MHAKNSLTNNADSYLESTEYLDADHPLVGALAEKLTHGAETDVERIRAIYLYVRDLPYDILESFRYLAAGQRSASAVLEHGVAFCMGKASSFVALSRAAGVPARVAFQTLDSPERSSCRRRFGHSGAANAVGRCPGTRWGKPSSTAAGSSSTQPSARRRPHGSASLTRRNSTESPTSILSKAQFCARMVAMRITRRKSGNGTRNLRVQFSKR
jgi:hypothetical protein